MESLRTIEAIKEVLRCNGNVPKSMKRIHDLIIYNINLDEYVDDDQTMLYSFNEVIKVISLIEKIDFENSSAFVKKGQKSVERLKFIMGIGGGGKISSIFKYIHDVALYQIDIDFLTKKHLTALRVLDDISEALKPLENEMFPESEKIKELQNLLAEKENRINELKGRMKLTA